MALVTVEEYEARQSEIRSRLQEIDSEFQGRTLPDDVRSEWDGLNEELERNADTIQELVIRRERILELQGETPPEREARPTGTERGAGFHTARPGAARGDDIYDLTTVRSSVTNPEQAAREMRDRAKRSIEQAGFPHESANREDVQTHIERLLDVSDTPYGEVARHLLTTGSPVYARAFGKYVSGGHLTQDESRALSIGTSSAGGYAVPYTLDPTIIPTSNGSVNPLRAISRIETIPGNEWRGVSSAGVTASRVGEVAEATDNSPTLAQPTVRVERVDAFIPFSIEVDGDWGGLQAEMARLLQDAKDDEEATSFMTGDGNSPNPQGLITGATTVVRTTTRSTFAVGDVYKVEEALPPRFRSRGQWVANRAIYNKVRQFDTAGGAALWLRLAEGLNGGGNTGAELIGYPAHESSAMDSTTADSAKIAVLGDFRHFLIVDRIGMTVELIPHLFGTARNFPTGQRGLFAYWRNSSKVLAPNAFRVLQVDPA